MLIDEMALNTRFMQFKNAQAEGASENRRNATAILFNQFLQSRNKRGAENMAQAHP